MDKVKMNMFALKSGLISIVFGLLFSSLAFTQEDDGSDMEVPERGGTGQVTVITTPSKAKVYLGGEEIGITPIEEKSFPSGRHDLTIMLQGEELVSKRVNVWPNKTTKIEETLVMPYGTVIVSGAPNNTRIQIDDVDVGKTEGGPLTINNVQQGDHILKASRGAKKRKYDISVSGEDTTEVKIKF